MIMYIINSKSRNVLFLFIGLISLFYINLGVEEVNATVSNDDEDEDQTKNETAILNNEISLYDCDEGNIGNPDSAAVRLFSTLNKYNESVNYNKLNGKGNTAVKEVKINVKVPLEDAIDDVDQISIIGMVRGEYKLETINAKEALEKQGNNN